MCTFENFYCDAENRSFITSIKNILGSNYEKNPLILKGKTGIGKTHLLHGVQNELLRQNKDLKVIYVYAKDFME